MTFEEALVHLREGKKIRRDFFINAIQIMDGDICYVGGDYVQFCQDDINSNDWEIYEEESLQECMAKSLGQQIDKDIRLSYLEEIMDKLLQHKTRQMDENRKSSRYIEELKEKIYCMDSEYDKRLQWMEERIRLLEKK